jgi:hypothetical protein
MATNKTKSNFSEDLPKSHKWQFAPRFKKNGFGWKSDAPILRIREALAEIKLVAKKEPLRAAEGALLFLSRVSASLMHVDSSSGALGAEVNHTIASLVPILTKADVDESVRKKWMDRLWKILEDDEMPYLEYLGDFWGELCVSPALAQEWSDRLLPGLQKSWQKARDSKFSKSYVYEKYYGGTTPCFSSLLAAGQYEVLLDTLEQAPYVSWDYRRWGVKALLAQNKNEQALEYAESSRGLNNSIYYIAKQCEEILIGLGRHEDAYKRYGFEANETTTNLATFRAIKKKYPHKPPVDVLGDLIARTPSAEGKWFAAAKDVGFLDLAAELALRSPVDPRTLTRAARDYVIKNPEFAVASGLAALHWITLGYGYEITLLDVDEAWQMTLNAAAGSVVLQTAVRNRIGQMTDAKASKNLAVTRLRAVFDEL